MLSSFENATSLDLGTSALKLCSQTKSWVKFDLSRNDMGKGLPFNKLFLFIYFWKFSKNKIYIYSHKMTSRDLKIRKGKKKSKSHEVPCF